MLDKQMLLEMIGIQIRMYCNRMASVLLKNI